MVALAQLRRKENLVEVRKKYEITKLGRVKVRRKHGN